MNLARLTLLNEPCHFVGVTDKHQGITPKRRGILAHASYYLLHIKTRFFIRETRSAPETPLTRLKTANGTQKV